MSENIKSVSDNTYRGEDGELRYDPIEIDTQSFLIGLDESFTPNIKILNPKISEIYKGDNTKITAACISELAHELFYAKQVLEETLQDNHNLLGQIELLDDTVMELEDELAESISDCELLRDELDKF